MVWFSVQMVEQEYPKNIWSVIELWDGRMVPLESQLENPANGTYHGYPVPESDPMFDEVLKRLEERAK